MDTVKIMNALRGVASADYQNRVPVATQNNIEQVGNPILEYQSIQNEFLNLLVNRIAFSVVQSRIANNPLAILKKGQVPLGSDIEDIFVNMAKAQTYDPDGKNLLQRKIPDVKACYYRMNRQDMYKVTISNDQLRTAFTNWSELERLIAGIVNSLYSGDNYDEFLLMKGLVESAVNSGLIVTKVVTAPTDETTGKAFVKAIRGDSSLFEFPSSNFNKYTDYATKIGMTDVKPVVTWTPNANQIILIRADVLTNIQVDVLASAFNMSETDFMNTRVVKVDKFDDAGNIQAVLCDEAFFQVWDNMSQMTEFFNGEGLYWQYMWHHWETFAVSPFANAVAYVKTAPAEETAPQTLTLTTPATLNLQTGDTSNIGIEFDPNTPEVNRGLSYTSSDTSVARVSKGGRITAVGKGHATITIKATTPKSGTSSADYKYATVTLNVNVADNN